jgi:uncharacterized SAM-binding protein YcdF (DUF218 family)
MARSRRPWHVPLLVGRLLFVLFGLWVVGLAAIGVWSRRNAAGHADAIIVLGAAQYGGRPSPVLRSRLDHALTLWKDRRAPRIVLTGGRRTGDLISEAAAGRRYLMRRGVSASAILLEPDGRTSLASMRAAAALLNKSRGRGSKPRVLLVSDPFHMLRLSVLARLHGLTPMSSPTRTSPISGKRAVLEYMVRESLAIPADVTAVLLRRSR